VKYYAIVFVAIGLAILFVGDTVASVGDKVDSLVRNKWTGVSLLVIGAIVFILSESSFKLKFDRSL
jgi:hypothetical protein